MKKGKGKGLKEIISLKDGGVRNSWRKSRQDCLFSWEI